MNFAQRAWRYITRTKVKSLLLILTFFVIGNLVILGLGISEAAQNAKVLTRKSMRAIVSYELDTDSFYKYADGLSSSDEMQQAYANRPKVEEDEVSKLANDSRVKAYNFNVSMNGTSDGFDNVPLGNETTDDNGNVISAMGYTSTNIKVTAGSSLRTIELTEGTISVVSGNYYTQANIDNEDAVCLITKELADLNGLSVGDDISINLLDKDSMKNAETQGIDSAKMKLNLTICGIYTTKADVDRNADDYKWMSASDSPKNTILMPMSTYITWGKQAFAEQYKLYYSGLSDMTSYTAENLINDNTTPSSAIYLLNDPLEVDQFVSDHTGELSQYMWLNADNATFKKLARPLDTLNFFSSIIVWIVVVNAIIIITLVTALSMKTREYEIGVLLSMGTSKMKIVTQMFLELIMIAIVGFSLAVASGSVIAGKVGDLVLSYQTTSDAQYGDNKGDTNYYFTSSNNYFTSITQDDMLAQYHVKVSPTLIMEIYLLGAGVVLIAIVIPSFMIMRLNPKQILLEQG
ncbi:MAG: ABC transporter permease [Erysipelotrichia bacterium]|nr:ABC transporter permease [Erysipelotrichia bacterium]